MSKDFNIFDECFLVVLSTKCWGNTKRIKKDKLEEVTEKELTEWVGASKKLIAPKSLEKIHSIISKARSTIKKHTLPFPIESVYLVAKTSIEVLAQELNDIIEEFNLATEEFASDYSDFISEARLELDQLFNESDYPQEIRTKFEIIYRFMEMSVPGQMSKISPTLYREEMDKFKNLMEQTRNEGIMYLREGFLQVIQGLVNSLSGKEDGTKKRLRESIVDKVEVFYNEFQNKNIFKDEELTEIIERAREVFIGIEGKDLRSSTNLQGYIKEEMEEISNILQDSIVDYKRRITL